MCRGKPERGVKAKKETDQEAEVVEVAAEASEVAEVASEEAEVASEVADPDMMMEMTTSRDKTEEATEEETEDLPGGTTKMTTK
jgi:hypothetical protein